MGKGIELQEDLSHDAHGRHLLVLNDTVELPGGLSDEIHQSLGAVTEYRLSGQSEIFVTQQLSVVRCPLWSHMISILAQTAHSAVIEFRDGVAIEKHCRDDRSQTQPWHIECRALVLVFVLGTRRHAQGDQRHTLETVGIESTTDQRGIVRRTALSTGLTHHHRHLVGIIFPRPQCLDKVADDQRGRIAHLIIGVLQSILRTLGIAGRKHLHIPTDQTADRRQQRCEIFRKVRSQDMAGDRWERVLVTNLVCCLRVYIAGGLLHFRFVLLSSQRLDE